MRLVERQAVHSALPQGHLTNLHLTEDMDRKVDGAPIVYVDFDTGQTMGAGGTGSIGSPLLTVGEALSAVAADGMILISGLVPSPEAPIIIDQPLTLQNNNAGLEVVTIAPVVARDAALRESGFVSPTASPRRLR